MNRLLLAFVIVLAAWTPLAARAQAPPAAAEEENTGDCVGKARLRGLQFSHNGSEIKGVDAVMLDPVAEVIKTRCAGKTITIEGHTSISGSPEYNQKLSERRAQAVMNYLISRGVPASQLRAVGYGESRPLTTDPSEEAQKVNRRVTLVAS